MTFKNRNSKFFLHLEFEEWKGRIEDYANSSFVLKHSNSTSMNYSKQLYVCSRNETYKLEGAL